jgi:hypothetical protein
MRQTQTEAELLDYHKLKNLQSETKTKRSWAQNCTKQRIAKQQKKTSARDQPSVAAEAGTCWRAAR